MKNKLFLTVALLILFLTIGFAQSEDSIDVFSGNKAPDYTTYWKGVDYFNDGKYRKAAVLLEKYQRFYRYDFDIASYLYYSYLYGGRTNSANNLTAKMPIHFKQKLNTKPNYYIPSIYAEFLYSQNLNYNTAQQLALNQPSDIYGEAIFQQSNTYTNLTFSQVFFHRFELMTSASYLSFDNLSRMEYDQIRFDPINRPILDRYHINQRGYTVQKQLYFSPSVSLGRGFVVSGGFHILDIQTTNADLNTYFKDTSLIYYDWFFRRPIDTVIVNVPRSFVRQNISYMHDYLFSGMVTKDFEYFKTGIAYSFSKFNSSIQNQMTYSLTYFPFANLDMYSNIEFIQQMQNSDNKKETNFMTKAKFGAKLSSHLWTELSVSHGLMNNFNESNGYVVFNESNKINWRVGLSFILYFEKLSFTLSTTLQDKQSEMIRMSSDSKLLYNQFQYKYFNISGGLKWTL